MNKPDTCKRCPLYGRPYVPAVGDIGSTIVIIGEAPGATEEKYSRPFVGGSGKILDRLLASVEINRAACYITNAVKCRPPNNNVKSVDGQAAVAWCRPIIYKEIKAMKGHRVIVPMENTALSAVIDVIGVEYPDTTITELRGIATQTPYGIVIPTFHPTHIMRQQHEFYTAQADWQKIAKYQYQKVVPEPKERFNINPTITDVEQFAYKLQDRATESQISIGLDIETYIRDNPLQTPIKLLGIASSESEAIVIPFINQSGQLYWQTEYEAVRAAKAIGMILENPRITKIVHNSLFDILICMNHGWTIAGPIYDTMLAHHLIYHLSKQSLAYLVSIYLDYPAWKITKGDSDAEYREYNARDCVVLKMLHPLIEEDIDSNGVRWVFDNLMKVIVPTCQMTINGLHIDQPTQMHTKTRLQEDIESLLRKLWKLSDNPGLNPGSPKELRETLFNQMKLKSQVKTPGGLLSTNEAVLNKLSIRYPDNQFVETLLRYRKVQKLSSTYADPPILSDGRVHSQFKLTVVTGRYGSSNPNVQNLPKKGESQVYIKKMYQAPSGKSIISADFSQAELIVFATLTNDEEWLTAFADGVDIHQVNGAALTREYYEKYRTFYKNFIYGFIYGSEGSEIEKVVPRELLKQLTISDILNGFEQRHPNMFSYQEEIQRQIRIDHRVSNPFGRTRFFVGTPTKKDFREGYNYPIQSTVGDIMHIKMGLLNSELRLDIDKLILQLHDAFYLEVADRRINMAIGILKEIMEYPVLAPNGMEFKLKVSLEVGKNLQDMAKYDIREKESS